MIHTLILDVDTLDATLTTVDFICTKSLMILIFKELNNLSLISSTFSHKVFW